jgi:hypothetical protein
MDRNASTERATSTTDGENYFDTLADDALFEFRYL